MHTDNMHYMHITCENVSLALLIKKNLVFTKALTRSNVAIKIMSVTLTISCYRQGACTYNDSHSIRLSTIKSNYI